MASACEEGFRGPGVFLGLPALVLPGWTWRSHMAPGPVHPPRPGKIKLVTGFPSRGPGIAAQPSSPCADPQPLHKAQPRPRSPGSYHSEAGETPATSPFRALGGRGVQARLAFLAPSVIWLGLSGYLLRSRTSQTLR